MAATTMSICPISATTAAAGAPAALLNSDAAPDADAETFRRRPGSGVRCAGHGVRRAGQIGDGSQPAAEARQGHVVELDRKVGEAIDIYVNDRLVARGEVVLVEDRLGVTMTEIIKAGSGRKTATVRNIPCVFSSSADCRARSARPPRSRWIAGRKSPMRATSNRRWPSLRGGARRGSGVLRRGARTSASWCAALAAERICTPVVACGIGTDTRRAVDAIRAGAKEYLPLPPDPELIAAVLAAVADECHQLVYEDEAMGAVLALADQVAGSEASILITGESGTGKEVLARYVHRKSLRADKPFISVNCAAIPENLLESELFGHEKGAFTGAIARRIGKFEEANGGTLLLDEISEMDARLQAKLLRAIQEREIDRVGGTKPVKVDIRIIATSNRDLAEAVKHGTFREDLLYRLNVVNLRLPALRERPKDIRALAHHFARKYAEANGVPYRPIASRDRAAAALAIPGAAMCASWKTPSIAPCCWRPGAEIAPEAIRLPDGTQVGHARATDLPEPRCRARWNPRPPSRAAWSAAPSPMSSAT